MFLLFLLLPAVVGLIDAELSLGNLYFNLLFLLYRNPVPDEGEMIKPDCDCGEIKPEDADY